MTGDDAPISLDGYPDPVLAYAVEDGTPVVTAANDAFESAFASVSTGTRVTAVLDGIGTVDTPGNRPTREHLVGGDTASLALDTADERGSYVARIAPAGGDGGHLVFVPLDERSVGPEPGGVGQVASAISHDLRNPLDVAKAHLRAARETGEAEHFDAVADAHDRMGQIVRDVLTLAKGEDAVDASDRVRVAAAVEDAWGSVETDAATLDVTGSLPTVTGDADRVRRLFENLFRNAVEHGGERPVTVRVGAFDDGFYVADDGPGIPAEAREAVFDPGYTTSDGGTGLGLAIVERIAHAHDWELALTTSRDGGARLEVRL